MWGQLPLPLCCPPPGLPGVSVVEVDPEFGVEVVGASWAAAQPAPPTISAPATASVAATRLGVQTMHFSSLW